ncbi:MAG: PspC domain-containing protein [Acidimicrobiales bacterium]
MPRIDPDDRWIGGVAAAVATELGVEAIVIRAIFAVLALASGWFLLVYLALWIGLAVAEPRRIAPYRPQPKAATGAHRYLAVTMIAAGLLLVFGRLPSGLSDRIVFPTAFVATGFLIAWTRHRDEDGTAAVIRIVAGVFVGVGGMIAFIALSARLVDALLILLVAIAVVAGMALVAAPSLARIGRDLDDERQNRVRADERARVAAHLHDSVLQTLALIQRHADDPTRTSQLARRQERELRAWLYSPSVPTPLGDLGPTNRLGPALERMAADVDEAHGVAVDVIVVGDADLAPEVVETLTAAAREATVNAAKHSGAARVDVFAERLRDRVEIFVRDTGRGFEPEATAADRRGIAESIVGRMRRVGGSATIHSLPGDGTEVELVLPLPGDATTQGAKR